MKNVILGVCLICWLTPYVAAESEENGTADNPPLAHHGLALDMVAVPPSFFNYLPNRPPAPVPAPNNLDNFERSLRRAILLKLLYDYWVARMTTTPASTTPETTTADPPTTVVMDTTVADPCASWPTIHGCKYQIFGEKITWQAARDKCKTICPSAVLVHQKVRTPVEIVSLIAGLAFPPTETAWIDLSDADSFGATANPLWNKVDAYTGNTFAATAYKTLVGTPGCGYIGPTVSGDYEFQACSSVMTATPSNYICEIC